MIEESHAVTPARPEAPLRPSDRACRSLHLGANLHYFRDKYDAILANRDERRDILASVRGTPYRRVERLFYDYIKAQRTEVDSMLNKLSALESQTDVPNPN